MAKYRTAPPFFHPNFFFTKMTQNGLKWILNTTLKIVTFFFLENFPYKLANFLFLCTSLQRLPKIDRFIHTSNNIRRFAPHQSKYNLS